MGKYSPELFSETDISSREGTGIRPMIKNKRFWCKLFRPKPVSFLTYVQFAKPFLDYDVKTTYLIKKCKIKQPCLPLEYLFIFIDHEKTQQNIRQLPNFKRVEMTLLPTLYQPNSSTIKHLSFVISPTTLSCNSLNDFETKSNQAAA